MADIALVTGGTGTIGRLVVPHLRQAGYRVRVLSRNRQGIQDGIEHVAGDLDSGEGIDAAVQDAAVIVHCAGSARGDANKARNLVLAATAAGNVRHLTHISVVGVDRIPVVSGIDRGMFGYFAEKLAAEQVIEQSGLPWTILRSTQTHDLLLLVAQQMAKMPIVPLPAGFKVQPVDAADVAERLASLALGSPQGLVPDIAGPHVHTARDLMRGYLRAAGKHRPILPMWLPGRAARAFRRGANLSPDRAVGRKTWDDFLAERVIAPREAEKGILQGA